MGVITKCASMYQPEAGRPNPAMSAAPTALVMLITTLYESDHHPLNRANIRPIVRAPSTSHNRHQASSWVPALAR